MLYACAVPNIVSRACIRMIGDELYSQSHKILKTMPPEDAEGPLEELLGPQLLEDCGAMLTQLVLCEQSLEKINQMSSINAGLSAFSIHGVP